MPTTDMEIISEQLDLLVNYHALGETERGKILKELEGLKKQPDKFKEYSESLSKGLPGVTKGVIGAIDASKSGDPIAISIAAVDIFGGVLTMSGPLLGPFGPLASALAGMLSTILGSFLPKPPSLKQQLTDLLNKFEASSTLRKLGAALDEIWVLSDTIETALKNQKKVFYDPIDLRIGTEIKQIDKAWQWIIDEEKQAVPEWDQVLEKVCMLWVQILRCVTLIIAKPSDKAGVEKDAILAPLESRQKLFLDYLRSIKPVAQQRGTYVHVGFYATGLALYTAPGRPGNLNWKYEGETQWMKTISVHLPKGQVKSPTPRYDLYAAVEGPKAIARHQLDSVTGAVSGKQQVMLQGREYTNIGGGTRRFENCVDACALPDWEDPKRTRVYTAHDAKTWQYVNVHVVEADNSVKRVNWEPHTGRGLAHIRALVGDITKSLPNDPDVAGLPAHGLYEIIYGGYSGNRNLWVELDNSWADVTGPKNWRAYSGIEVDPYCLWMFGEGGIACATHASVIQCKNGKLDSPRWIYHDFVKEEWKPAWPPVVDSLYPCADDTLAAVVNTSIYTANYRIDRASNRIVTSSWLKRDGKGQQIVKMPIPGWPIFSEVKRDLEKQVGAQMLKVKVRASSRGDGRP